MIAAFDLDGTLITAETKQTSLLQAIMTRYGLVLNASEAWKKKQNGLSNSKLLQEMSVDSDISALITQAWLREIETPYWLSFDTLFDDTWETLSTLRDSKVELVLITARQNEYYLRQQLFNLGLNRLFTQIFCVSPKSAVANKHTVLTNIGASVFFGDSETDFEAASKANVPFFGVSTGQRSALFLHNSGVANVSDSLHLAVVKAGLNIENHKR